MSGTILPPVACRVRTLERELPANVPIFVREDGKPEEPGEARSPLHSETLIVCLFPGGPSRTPLDRIRATRHMRQARVLAERLNGRSRSSSSDGGLWSVSESDGHVAVGGATVVVDDADEVDAVGGWCSGDGRISSSRRR